VSIVSSNRVFRVDGDFGVRPVQCLRAPSPDHSGQAGTGAVGRADLAGSAGRARIDRRLPIRPAIRPRPAKDPRDPVPPDGVRARPTGPGGLWHRRPGGHVGTGTNGNRGPGFRPRHLWTPGQTTPSSASSTPPGPQRNGNFGPGVVVRQAVRGFPNVRGRCGLLPTPVAPIGVTRDRWQAGRNAALPSRAGRPSE